MAATVAGLRRWAAGSATDAAAVELLGLVANGRLLAGSAPWVRPCGRLGWYWLDPQPLILLLAGLKGRDRQLVSLVVALLADTQPGRRVAAQAAAA